MYVDLPPTQMAHPFTDRSPLGLRFGHAKHTPAYTLHIGSCHLGAGMIEGGRVFAKDNFTEADIRETLSGFFLGVPNTSSPLPVNTRNSVPSLGSIHSA